MPIHHAKCQNKATKPTNIRGIDNSTICQYHLCEEENPRYLAGGTGEKNKTIWNGMLTAKIIIAIHEAVSSVSRVRI